MTFKQFMKSLKYKYTHYVLFATSNNKYSKSLFSWVLPRGWLTFSYFEERNVQQRSPTSWNSSSLSPWVDNCRIGMMRSSIYASVTLLIVTFATIKSRDLTRSIFCLARSILALRDQFWPCKIVFGLAKSFLAFQDQFWPYEDVFGLASSIFGLARSILALRDPF